jgi:hypothetical protein
MIYLASTPMGQWKERSLPATARLKRFEDRLRRTELTGDERRILEVARSLARRGGSLDLQTLVAKAGRPARIVRRRRESLELRGLWPWSTDKHRVGRPRRGLAELRQARSLERRMQVVRAARLARLAWASPAFAKPNRALSNREICRGYLEEFQQLRRKGFDRQRAQEHGQHAPLGDRR